MPGCATRTRGGKSFAVAVLVFALFLLITAGTLGILGLLFRDGPAPNDADLLIWPAAVRADLNGYQHVIGGEQLRGSWTYEQKKEVEELTRADDPNLERARDLLGQGRELLGSFRRCVSAPHFQAPEGEVPSFYSLGSMAELASLEAVLLFKEGREEEAFDLALEILSLGHRVQLGGDDMSHLVGGCIKNIGYRRLWALSRGCHLGSDQLLCYVKALSQFSGEGAVFAQCQRRKYSTTARLIDGVAAGEVSGHKLASRTQAPLLRAPVIQRGYRMPMEIGGNRIAHRTRPIMQSSKLWVVNSKIGPSSMGGYQPSQTRDHKVSKATSSLGSAARSASWPMD